MRHTTVMHCTKQRLSSSSVLQSHLLSSFLDVKPKAMIESSQNSLDDLGDGSQAYETKLPPEIWLKVFELLVHIPGVFELSNGHAIEAYSEDPNGIILHGLYDDSMRMKLTISLVSRTWRRLVLPLLFEYVIIKTARHAQVVANALARFKLRQDEHEYYGRWVRRVEVLVQDVYWEQESIDALVRVLKLSSNALVFSDFFSTSRLPDYSTHGIVKILRRLCENGCLRRLESSGACIPQLHRLLRNIPSIEVLIAKRLSLRPVSLPKLRTLVSAKAVMTFACELENLEAPNLQNLILHNTARYEKLNCGQTRIRSLYPNLKHLRFDWTDPKLSMCYVTDIPALTSLTLDLGLWQFLDDLEKLRIAHPALQRINLIRFTTFIQRARLEHDGDGQVYISNFLLSILRDNPSLRAIGFLRDRSYFDMGNLTKQPISRERGPHLAFWENFLAQCRDQGVLVEASVGASDHFCGIWQPFHLGLVPHRIDITKIQKDLFRLCI